MTRPGFQLDHAGVEKILQSPAVMQMVNALAEQVAANVRGQLDDDVPVEVDTYTSDRQVASVAIKHPGGRGFQLQRGALTRAAGMVGLEVRSK
ncbi:hypothetical protein [Rhodococcus spongiicola]|uniref:HK97 gp10 family phage protein n=1 Tax=Rhodococcus spongiicola TaxID=2487352 RepID=A0A438B716_9NOCA|nr:hypothetical protein [Rhodococcus spongiicola]RVW06741.1 hypothetical protein EF834_01875 [Rhodococcus spongiicola]